jgi:hypothetical protein
MTLAGGKVVVALEGGYNLKSISTSMEAVVRTLLGDALPRFDRRAEGGVTFTPVRRQGLQAISETMQALSPYWPVFQRTLSVFEGPREVPAPVPSGMAAAFATSDSEEDVPDQDSVGDNNSDGDSNEREPASKRPRADADSSDDSPL